MASVLQILLVNIFIITTILTIVFDSMSFSWYAYLKNFSAKENEKELSPDEFSYKTTDVSSEAFDFSSELINVSSETNETINVSSETIKPFFWNMLLNVLLELTISFYNVLLETLITLLSLQYLFCCVSAHEISRSFTALKQSESVNIVVSYNYVGNNELRFV